MRLWRSILVESCLANPGHSGTDDWVLRRLGNMCSKSFKYANRLPFLGTECELHIVTKCIKMLKRLGISNFKSRVVCFFLKHGWYFSTASTEHQAEACGIGVRIPNPLIQKQLLLLGGASARRM